MFWWITFAVALPFYDFDQVSALVTLYSHIGDVSAAVDILDEAVEHAQKNKVGGFFVTCSLIQLRCKSDSEEDNLPFSP